MSKNLIVVIISYVLIAAIVLGLYLNNKKTVKKMGECLLPLQKGRKIGMIAVDITAVVLLAILIFRDLGNSTAILAACCVLSAFITTKDGFMQKYYGVYEKGLIAPNYIVFYADILNFPVFELPPEEQKHYAKNSLVVVTEKKGKIEIIFSDDEQCAQVVAKLKQLNVITIDID